MVIVVLLLWGVRFRFICICVRLFIQMSCMLLVHNPHKASTKVLHKVINQDTSSKLVAKIIGGTKIIGGDFLLAES